MKHISQVGVVGEMGFIYFSLLNGYRQPEEQTQFIK